MNSLEMLSKIASLSVTKNNFNNQMNNILKIIGKYTNVSRTYIFIDNEDSTYTRNEFEWCNVGIKSIKHLLQNRKYSDFPSMRNLFLEKGRIFSQNIEDLPNSIYKVLKEENIKSLIAYPIIIENKMKGFIGCDVININRKWKESELNIISTIAGFVSNLYENHFYSLKIMEDKKYFEDFFNTITDFIIIGDIKGNIIYANEATIKNLEYSPNELFNMHILDLHPKEKKDEATSILNDMFEGKLETSPLELISKNNVIIPVETRIWFGKWNNEDCIFGLSKNISKEQEALQKFTKIFKHNPALMALSDYESKKFVDVNTSFLDKLGYSYDEVIGKTSTQINLFPNPHKHEKTTEKLSSTGNIKNIELDVRCKEGKILHGLFSGEIILSNSKKYFLTVMIDITEKINIEQKYKELSIRDSLTNIYNRRYIFSQLEKNLEKYVKYNQIFSIAIIDIDYFKKINDKYGHITGDHILVEFTREFTKNLKDTHLFGRYGGEEFIIVAKNETKQELCTLVNKILKILINKTFNAKLHNIKLSFSAGISDSLYFDKNDITIEQILNIADERLYKAKQNGRQCVELE